MTDPAYGSLHHEAGQPIVIQPAVLPPPSRQQIVAVTIATVTTALGATIATVACAAERLQGPAVIVALAGYSSAAVIGRRLISLKQPEQPGPSRSDRQKERDRVYLMVQTGAINGDQAHKLLEEIETSHL